MHEVVKYRQYNAEKFAPLRCSSGIAEYLPWTAASGKHGLKTCLNTMVCGKKMELISQTF